MTRKAVLELIQERCRFVDNKNQYPIQYIEGYCDQIWKDTVSGLALSPDADLSFYSKLYLAEVLSMDTGSEYYYLDLPEEIVNIPRIGSGVASIKTTNAFDNYFSPVTEDDFGLMLSQDVGRISEDIFYYVGYDKIWFSEAMTALIAAAGVDIRLIIPFSKYLYTESVPLPVVSGVSFVDAVVERIVGTPPTNNLTK